MPQRSPTTTRAATLSRTRTTAKVCRTYARRRTRILFPIGQKTLAEAHARRSQAVFFGSAPARPSHPGAAGPVLPPSYFTFLDVFSPVNVVHKGRVAGITMDYTSPMKVKDDCPSSASSMLSKASTLGRSKSDSALLVHAGGTDGATATRRLQVRHSASSRAFRFPSSVSYSKARAPARPLATPRYPHRAHVSPYNVDKSSTKRP